MESENQPEKKRVNFDPTINLGHLLTFCGFICAGFGAYWTLDKRVSLLEDRAVQLEVKLRENNTSVKESLKEIKEDVKDMRQAVENVSNAIIKKVLHGIKE